MNDYLAQSTLMRLLAVLAIVIAPHVVHMPVWCSVAVALVIAWRALASLRQWRLPPRSLRAALVTAAFIGVYVNFGRFSGQTAGVALLAVMASLKLTELHARRDVIFLVFLMYFMLVTHFLFSQEMWTIAYLLVCAVLITGLLIEINHAGRPMRAAVSLRLGGTMVLQALPLMVVLFVLFPRLPGPLWGLPQDDGAARSGLSDTMSPGDISQLIESDAVAFRVTFDGPAPPPEQLYWRGPVLDETDGRRWQARPHPDPTPPPAARLQGNPVRYDIVIEPTQQHWLFALDVPDTRTVPDGAWFDRNDLLHARDLVRERRLYSLVSYPHYFLEPRLPARERELNLRLPLFANPRTRALAHSWREQGLDDRAIVDKALAMFRQQPFYYTLHPPRLGREPVDEFLFDTRHGFCEHFAGAFVTLMRAAGIPARVVVGYQGGSRNAVGGYYVVSQSDAHAWSEVWLADQGWVRVDPTAAVAPGRVDPDLANMRRESGALAGQALTRRHQAWFQFQWEARWDWLNERWNRWVLAYGPELQHDLLSRFGLDGWEDLMLALTAVMAALMGLFGAWSLYQARPVHDTDAAQRAWLRALQRLARGGLRPTPGEGPRDFALRVARARPDLAAPMGRISSLYLRLRYVEEPDARLQKALEQAVAGIKP